jgi:hypothetical protein
MGNGGVLFKPADDPLPHLAHLACCYLLEAGIRLGCGGGLLAVGVAKGPARLDVPDLDLGAQGRCRK